MIDPRLDDGGLVAAGEYVLGTLDASERAAFRARLLTDRLLAAAVRWWERALAPLAAGVDEAPPTTVWAAILARIGQAGVGGAANDPGMARGPGFWRTAALGAGTLAAGLALLMVARPAPKAPPPQVRVIAAQATPKYLAAVNAKGNETALLLTLDARTGAVVAHPVKLSAVAQRSLELWWIADGAAPRAVGLIDPAQGLRGRIPVAAKLLGGTFAVSVEPVGGSPTGAPTGEVRYTGQVVPS